MAKLLSHKRKAIDKINSAGALLVFPIENKKEPASLWSAFYPKQKMVWKWDESSDHRVGDLWHLRTELSACGEVVYAKWFRGRASFFSKEVFTALLACLETPRGLQKPLGEHAKKVLELLEEDSPQSPKSLRAGAGLETKYYASAFERALRELWMRLHIVGFGEFDDGAFPSLAIGASRLLFEDLWENAAQMSKQKGADFLIETLGEKNPFYEFLGKAQKKAQFGSAFLKGNV